MERILGILLTNLLVLMLIFDRIKGNEFERKENIEMNLKILDAIATKNFGIICVTKQFHSLSVPLETARFESIQQKADLTATFLQDLETDDQNELKFQNIVLKNLLLSEKTIISSRIIVINATTGLLVDCIGWQKRGGHQFDSLYKLSLSNKTQNVNEHIFDYPWYPNRNVEVLLNASLPHNGQWTHPYYSCVLKRWLISYNIPLLSTHRKSLKRFLSLDVDISHLEVNQCEGATNSNSNEIFIFHNTHKCHFSSECIYRPQINNVNWSKGRYQCKCKAGYYSKYHNGVFDGTLVEISQQEIDLNRYSQLIFQCKKCAPGCFNCTDSSPCLATYNWPFRIILLVISITCASCTILINILLFMYRKLKVFKVASPIFLSITLFGCAIMYLEMAAIFPILDTYSCIATKWLRHLGFCVTYTALLMKTWRVSLTYRVKSAHKIKLTDKELLQWMVPILLIMLIYLGTWTLSDTPTAEEITDNKGLKFKQCVYNWWDHSLAIGEILFLVWGVRICYNVRNAESLFNEARLISYAIYNITIVNILMIAFHLFIFPQAGPDFKYFLGFVRTQLSTSVTVSLVFVPKIIRVIRGQGNHWDRRTKSQKNIVSIYMNDQNVLTEEKLDLYQENEELKEEIQKLSSQIECLKIARMGINNRHIKQKRGGYFAALNIPNTTQNNLTKRSSFITKPEQNA